MMSAKITVVTAKRGQRGYNAEVAMARGDEVEGIRCHVARAGDHRPEQAGLAGPGRRSSQQHEKPTDDQRAEL